MHSTRRPFGNTTCCLNLLHTGLAVPALLPVAAVGSCPTLSPLPLVSRPGAVYFLLRFPSPRLPPHGSRLNARALPGVFCSLESGLSSISGRTNGRYRDPLPLAERHRTNLLLPAACGKSGPPAVTFIGPVRYPPGTVENPGLHPLPSVGLGRPLSGIEAVQQETGQAESPKQKRH